MLAVLGEAQRRALLLLGGAGRGHGPGLCGDALNVTRGALQPCPELLPQAGAALLDTSLVSAVVVGMAWARASPLRSLCCLPQAGNHECWHGKAVTSSPSSQAGKQPSALGLHDLPAQATRKAARQQRGPQRTPWQELCWDQQRLCSPAAAPPAAPVMYTSRIPSPLPRAEGWRQGSRHQRAQSIQPGGPLLPARCLQPRGAASIPPAARATLGHHPACCRQLPRTKPP